MRHDLAVVGGGIVGLATARAVLERSPRSRVVVLEKEPRVAAHQSGRNSGVLHSGLYYPPGSLKARLCMDGAAAMVRFCREHDLPCAVTGKLVVATRTDELPRLAALEQRGRRNGLTVTRLDAEGAREHEPHVAALAALHVAETGVVDFAAVCRRLAELFTEAGGELRTDTEVTAIGRDSAGFRIHTTTGDVGARLLVNCAGLHSDRVARLDGTAPGVRIVGFRGEYHELRPAAAALVSGLVYPVPDPDFPFLGVHLTKGIDGTVHAGPNAVLALSREGYRWRDVRWADMWDVVADPGFRRLARRHARQGAAEVWRSLWRPAFLREVQRLVPELGAADLVRSPAGVRAQALRADGTLVEDFLVITRGGALHVLNAPSPAATASLSIGDHLADRLGAP